MIARLGIDVYIVKVATFSYILVFQFIFWDLVVLKYKLDAGSHKPLAEGLKWGT
jgi:hypothetical protein